MKAIKAVCVTACKPACEHSSCHRARTGSRSLCMCLHQGAPQRTTTNASSTLKWTLSPSQQPLPPPSAVHQQAINPGSHLPVRLWSSGMSTWDLRPSELWEHLGGGVGEMQPWGEREDVQRHSYTDEGQHVDSQQDWWLSSSGQISKVWV